MSDQVANAIKVTISGTYDASATEITLVAGQGAELPDPSGDNYNLPWWDSTNYGDPADDPNLEIVRVTAKADDVITVTRAQEGTGASSKSTSGATYKMIMGVTAKTITDLIAETDVVGAGLTLHMSDTSTHGAAEVADVATVSAEIDSDISTHSSNGDAHHAEAHSIASHNDTTATGAELEDLTDGSDADALHAHGANDTHRTSDGSDHAYVDQSVVNGSSPAFLGTNITEIPAVNLEFTVIGTPTYHDAQDWFNIIQAAGIIDGFVMSNGREPTELDVSAGKGLIKIIDSDVGGTVSFETSAVENVTLTGNNINYVYVDYNAGTPQIVATTDRSTIELNRHFILGRVYKNGVTLHILNAGVHVPNLTRTEYERLVERDGFTHASGVIVTETGTLNLAITAGVWFLSHNRITTDAFDSSGTDTWIYTHYGAASWITDNATATDVDCTHYNDGTDVLASLGSNNYSDQWIYITADSAIYIIYGTINGTLSAATDATPPTSLPKYVETMGELIAKMIVKQSGEIISIAMVHDVKFTAVGVPNHNDLGGLQGGAANDYYHLTSAEITDLTDAGDSIAHYHANDRARANHAGTQASWTITVLATDRILGRKTGGGGTVEEMTKADVLAMLNVEDGADATDAVNIASSIVGVDDKATPVNADSIGIIDSAAANVLKELTWANVKATLKTYFDTLYNLYVHPNHSGDVTSVADGAQTIVANAVTYAKMQNISGGDRLLGRSTAGGGIVEEVTCTAVGRALLDDANVATQRNTLDVDIAGTDNSIDVTLGGTPDYITIAGQVITRNQIDLAADVTGKLPYANIQNVVNDERILGRVSGADGVVEELTAAQVLTMINVEAAADVTDAANVDSSGAVMESDMQNQSFTNLLTNGDLESWSAGASGAPDGWAAENNPTILREATIVRNGTYSAKITSTTTYSCLKYDKPLDFSRYQGRTITLGCWVHAVTSGRAGLRVRDNVAGAYSTRHAGGGDWEWITVSHTLNANATSLEIYLYSDLSGNNDFAYFDGAILVEGSICPAFSPKPLSANDLTIHMQTPQTLTGAGAVDIVSDITHIVTTAANALTLVDGANGQEKFIVMKTDDGAGTLTPSNLGNGSTITFDDVGDSAHLIFTNGAWHWLGGTATLA